MSESTDTRHSSPPYRVAVLGGAALLSAVPGLGLLEVVVGLLQIVWFLWFGIITVRIGSTQLSPSV